MTPLVEQLEPRLTPVTHAGDFFAGGVGEPPLVQLWRPTLLAQWWAFPPSYRGGLTLAVTDAALVVAAANGNAKVYDAATLQQTAETLDGVDATWRATMLGELNAWFAVHAIENRGITDVAALLDARASVLKAPAGSYGKISLVRSLTEVFAGTTTDGRPWSTVAEGTDVLHQVSYVVPSLIHAGGSIDALLHGVALQVGWRSLAWTTPEWLAFHAAYDWSAFKDTAPGYLANDPQEAWAEYYVAGIA